MAAFLKLLMLSCLLVGTRQQEGTEPDEPEPEGESEPEAEVTNDLRGNVLGDCLLKDCVANQELLPTDPPEEGQDWLDAVCGELKSYHSCLTTEENCAEDKNAGIVADTVKSNIQLYCSGSHGKQQKDAHGSSEPEAEAEAEVEAEPEAEFQVSNDLRGPVMGDCLLKVCVANHSLLPTDAPESEGTSWPDDVCGELRAYHQCLITEEVCIDDENAGKVAETIGTNNKLYCAEYKGDSSADAGAEGSGSSRLQGSGGQFLLALFFIMAAVVR